MKLLFTRRITMVIYCSFYVLYTHIQNILWSPFVKTYLWAENTPNNVIINIIFNNFMAEK